MSDREQLELAIAAQENLRGLVPDDVIDVAVAALRERLATTAVPDQRRRQATVMFADVRGYTSMASTLDAEVVTDIMNELWSRLDTLIEQYGGRIDKHIGDAVMAVWGADSAHEDDPEQAVRAALAMHDELAHQNAGTGRNVDMRVGISTGAVVLGAVATTREFTAIGDTVNVASRLEHAAPVGGVLISHDTYRHVRGVFDVAEQSPLFVKGKDEPLRVYVVHRAKPRSFRMPTRGVEGVETRMIGRDRELATLRDTFFDVQGSGRCQAVTIIGEAGVGKSRLLYEFETWIDLLPDQVFFLKARALASRQTVPYGLFRDLVAARFGILDSDTPEVLARKLREGFSPHLSDEQAELVGHWLGFDLSTSESAQRMSGSAGLTSVCSSHLAHFVRLTSASVPVLMVLEDLHWADEDSLDLLEKLIGDVASTPTLVVGATRASLLDRRPAWLGIEVATHRLVLEPLGADHTAAFVHEVLQKVESVPVSLTDLIVDRADGNPFFVEELIKMFIDDDVVIPSRDGDRWHIDLSRLDPAAVPSTLTGVLETRLDSLSAPERHTLQRASVVGRIFWDESVVAMTAERSAVLVDAALAVACQRELVYRRSQSSIEAATEYIFKHALLRDVAYETVLLRDRQQLHLRAAEWLTTHASERPSEFMEMIAEHHRLGGEPAAAADILERAGARALAGGRALIARRVLGRAMDLYAEGGVDPPAGALLELAESCCRLREFGAAEEILASVWTLPIQQDQEAQALYLASWVASERGERSEERRLLDRALPLAEQVGGAVLVHVLLGLIWLGCETGELDQTHAILERALELAEQLGDPAEVCRCLNGGAVLASLSGRTDECVEYVQRSATLARQAGDLEQEAHAVGNLGVMLHLRGDATGSQDDYRAAAESYRKANELRTRLGTAASLAVNTANLGQVLLRLGQRDDARVALDEALRLGLAQGLRPDLAWCLTAEADLRLMCGEVDLGLAILGAVLAQVEATEDQRQEVDRILARCSLSEDVIEAGIATGRSMDIEQLASDLMSTDAEGRALNQSSIVE